MTIQDDVRRFGQLTDEQLAEADRVKRLATLSMSLDYDELTQAEREAAMAEKREILKQLFEGGRNG